MTTICVWYEEGQTSLTSGWYWDDSEDHGGFDRISPMGPHRNREAAINDATAPFGLVNVLDGKPDHYPTEAEA